MAKFAQGFLPQEGEFISRTSAKACQLLNNLYKGLYQNLFIVAIYDKNVKGQGDDPDFYISKNESKLNFRDLDDFYQIYEEISPLGSIPDSYINEFQTINDQISNDNKLKISLLKTLNQFDIDNKLISFSTYPKKERDYFVFIILQINKDIYKKNYSLKKKIKNYHLNIPANFLSILIHFIISEIENKMDDYLKNLYNWGIPNESILRSAGDSFINVLINNNLNNIYEGKSKNLYNHINDICFQTYEGEEGSGSIIFSKKDNKKIRTKIKFLTKISIKDHRAVRKLLEMTDNTYSLLCDSEFIFGLGELYDYDGTDENLFVIRITKRYHWDLMHNGEVLMSVKHREPYVIKDDPDEDEFMQKLDNKFNFLSSDDKKYLWEIINVSKQQKHGTMIVISDKYKKELQRLKYQSILINPIKFEDIEEIKDFMSLITSIDGSVIIDTKGYCHAIGVILDGDAILKGDISRGARYHAALKYIETKDNDCLIVNVSEDGNAEIII